MNSTLVCACSLFHGVTWIIMPKYGHLWRHISHMGEILDSDWSRENLLRSDWSVLIGAPTTTCAFPSQRDCLICTVMSPVLWIVNTSPSDGNLKRFSNLLWTRPKVRNTIITCPNKIVALRCQASQDSTRVGSNTLLSCFKTGNYPSLRPNPPSLIFRPN